MTKFYNTRLVLVYLIIAIANVFTCQYLNLPGIYYLTTGLIYGVLFLNLINYKNIRWRRNVTITGLEALKAFMEGKTLRSNYREICLAYVDGAPFMKTKALDEVRLEKHIFFNLQEKWEIVNENLPKS